MRQVIGTVVPEWLLEQIKDQQQQRKDAKLGDEEERYVELDKRTLQELQESAF